ncbi:6,7-dimethyl-8-ribityllumazine synthase [Porphyromonas crevioricanis]|uniref:6,7-dimethyl-8-ribityllumazine synthase n=2 Tax=Porphyromonas crevioricanis TaxID=393921 RepID=A0A0A2FRT6_9PORP|nr:6,7-dimethyl-8-ribityllumazine synthase [Porphyromonas crevioricanis]KGN90964.1 6,7-dimethyl-8-ribityllumazine synthase [Porphyromonas crevioricanis]KGN95060.1 6,7-dimethyl-8-ribityllumazine synthase [Porphyromonas crevioricanis]SJZ54554.1 6,7-dimethyl-8-ribityllumazine synthase [Porphyromonas crevioricanis]SQH73291.1 6,7-dimethyl-8-ribityllumazine synthase [Porphyromonas crevioricanis]GAD06279.1 6,7-dimethyl-8-ribityllumazine synthase [Porphyromonas crevioricanis JCM 15906]
MATLAHIQSDELLQSPIQDAHLRKIAIVVAEWNSRITKALLDGAVETLQEQGVKEISVTQVPGTFELTYGCAKIVREGSADAVIAIGCVVRGDTPHFDYICQGVTQGLSSLNSLTDKQICRPIPVIFGVLTTNTMEQAEERAGGKLGNKGAEAAITALKMCAPYCYYEK